MFNLFISQDLKRVFKITGNNYVQKKVLKQVQEFVVEFDLKDIHYNYIYELRWSIQIFIKLSIS